MSTESRPFFLFESDLLQDRFLLIFSRVGLQLAKAAHPGVTVYHIQEFDIIYAAYPRLLARRAAFKKLHLLKKVFKGWLLPAEAGKLKFKWEEDGR